jgi:hypothetical protein
VQRVDSSTAATGPGAGEAAGTSAAAAAAPVGAQRMNIKQLKRLAIAQAQSSGKVREERRKKKGNEKKKQRKVDKMKDHFHFSF